MNENRVCEAAKQIAKRRAALAWLKQYGSDLGSGERGLASVTVHLSFASGCPGAKEATEVINAYGRFSLPEMVKAATQCCQNEIAMAIDAIREELARADQ